MGVVVVLGIRHVSVRIGYGVAGWKRGERDGVGRG